MKTPHEEQVNDGNIVLLKKNPISPFYQGMGISGTRSRTQDSPNSVE